MTEPRIYMRHARAARGGSRQFCTLGIREWVALHGIDLARFVKEGCPGEVALRIGDVFALRVLEFARTEARNNGR